MEMGSKLAQEKLDLVSNLLQMSGVYYCGRASWSKTEKCFEEAAASCQRTGDRRRYEECNIFLAMSLYLQVRQVVIHYARSLLTVVLGSNQAQFTVQQDSARFGASSW
jgi:hypothetical protein